MIGVGELIAGTATIVVGVEEHKHPRGVRVYLGHRAQCIYVVIMEGPEAEKARRVWRGSGGHVIMEIPPPEFLHQDGAGFLPGAFRR